MNFNLLFCQLLASLACSNFLIHSLGSSSAISKKKSTFTILVFFSAGVVVKVTPARAIPKELLT